VIDDQEESGSELNSPSAETYSTAEDILRQPSEAREYDAPPQSWKPDVASRHWSKLDPELRGYVHSREKEANGKITQQGQRLKELEATAQRVAELEGVSTRYQPINEVFERYRPHIPEGLEPAQAIEQMLQAHHLLSTPETREQAFVHLAQSCGIDPMMLLPPQMREQFQTAQRELQSTKQAEVQRTLDEFTKDKTYYAEIREDVIKEIVEIRKGAPGLDNATVLRLAHDRVIERTGIKSRLDEQAKAEQEGRTAQAQAERLKEMQEREKARREEEAKRVKAARRAAGINVKSSPATGRAPKTMDEDLRGIWQRNHG
jgi:hypothetical protein